MIHVSCAAEGPYVAHSAAMLHSVLAHAREVHVHYLHSPRFDEADAVGAVVRDGGGQLSFYEIGDERVADLPDDPLFTAAMWHRILLPELLPAVDRVLYLDVDTLALDDLAPLWATALEDRPVAAVTNVLQHDHQHRPAELGLPGPEAYFNSGVLLLNLDRMRRDGLTDALRRVALERGAELAWPDQDALNLVLGAERLSLHPRWNSMNSVYAFRPTARRMFGRRAARQARAHPAIRHFEGPGPNKPWHPDSTVPHRDAYWAHRRATPFSV